MRRKKLLAFVFIFGSLGAIPVFALGGHQAVELVDSAAFCTQVCHDVHYAEAVTYKVSPHSEVACSKCHVGDGTANLVRSKFRGVNDIIPAITGNYQKPIATPLKERRPSTETCQTCHWAEKFSGDKPRVKTSYQPDKSNTRNTLTLVLKVGGGKEEVASGIHWHAAAKIWYLPLDDQRQKIAWVATEDVSGNVTEYVDPDRIAEITPELIRTNKRQMDCVDCHNRVTHLFRSPDELIDAALSDGSIDAKLPFIKQQGVKALMPQNSSLREAYTKIAAIKDYYQSNYPVVFQEKSAAIDSSIAKLEEVARLTTFDNGLDWKTHPDNAVHDKPDKNMLVDWESLSTLDQSIGCFRCHGNLLKVDNPGRLTLQQSLDEHNISQFIERVNLTLDSLKNIPPPAVTAANITAYLAAITIQGDNQTAPFSGDNRTGALTSANLTALFPGDNRTAALSSANLTALIPTGAYPKEKGLQADCNSCHYTLKSPLISPLAPATSHPIDGLDDCLVCHNPSAARPFKTTHPWTTNEACNNCHQSAPKLKSLPVTVPPEKAMDMPHDPKGLEGCLVCHSPTAASPIKKEHPWSADNTCTACHKIASRLKPIPLSAPPIAPEISHPADGLEDCLSCHGQPAAMPFTTNHPWSTNKTCNLCHKPSARPLQSATPASNVMGPTIKHSLAGLEECSSCHQTTAGHPWTSSQTCTKCHQLNAAGFGGGGGGSGGSPMNPAPQPPKGPNITHSIAGLENCITCHNTSSTMLFPANHVGRPNSMCLICHQVAPPVSIPAAPSSLTALAASAGEVNLSWVDNSADETGFRIERATNSVFLTNLISTSVVANTAAYSDTTTTGSTTYYYRVFAANSAGDSPASNTALVTTPVSTATPPAAPTALAASAISATQVNLSWLDNSASETGFRIDRASSSNFGGKLVSVNTVVNAVSYSDTTVSDNSTYYYRVYAFNSAGNSAASNTASVTTPAVTIDPAALYATSCAVCHGINRQGGSASALTTSALSTVTLTQVISTITNGVGTMPAYSVSLTSAQITALAQWLKGAPPADPTNLTASAISAGRVNLFWLDNSTDETGFRIERATSSDFLTNLFTAQVVANSVSYSDTTTIGSTIYYYRVFAYSASGDSAASNIASATTPVSTATPPAIPTGLTASAIGATQINLTWLDNATTETGYRIDRATSSTFNANLVTTTLGANTTGYNDITVSDNTTYYYRVYAFNSAGNSAASNTATVTTPAAVIDPAALYAANCAVCHGANRQGGSASALTSSALSSRTLAQVTATITNGTTGMSAYSTSLTSAQISALAQWLKGNPPTAPSVLIATAVSAGQVNLTWVDNASDETGFRSERATESTFTANLVTNTVAANMVSYNDTTVTGNTTYYYRIFAINSSGDSVASNAVSVITPASTAAIPAVPTGVAADALSATQVNVTWIDNATNETGYRVDRATDDIFTTNLVTVNTAANAVSYSDTTVSGSTTYYYRIYAFNSAGNSAASNKCSVTTPAAPIDPAALYSANCASCHGANRQGGSASALTSSALSGRTLSQVTNTIANGTAGMPAFGSTLSSAQISALAQWLKGSLPSAPTNLTATAVSAGQINLTWVDNASDETGVRIQRATESTFTANLITTTVAANVVSYNDTTVTGNTTYYYRIFAINSAGDSAASNTVSVTTPASTVTPPAAPTGLSASASSASQVNLTWLDNSTTETGFRIDRATNSAFSVNLVTVNTAANSVSYSDTAVNSITTYYYRTYAFNSAGNSAASNIASVTTPAPGAAENYANYCSSCHGTSGQGASAPAVAGTAAPTTRFVVRGGGITMPSFNTTQISSTALTSLATYVTSLGPVPTTGSAIYSLDCAVCHGATGQGTKLAPYVAGVPVSTLSSITRSGLGSIMPAYSTTDISSTRLTTLANYILALGPPPSDGWGVYAEYCAVCHGTFGEGGSGGRIAGTSISTTTTAVRNGPDSMPAYTTTQISNTALTNLANYVLKLIPSRPSGLIATAVSASQINLTWTDNAPTGTILGMRLQRATNSAFSSGLVTFNLSLVTNYSDTTVSNGTTYYYRVYATSPAGTSSASTTATVTTP
ncbi:MAG: c-type cytochrome [Chloroflexi bacterium]|nr:c-type cytochrome [Chloroflexota bacterium]